MADSADEWLLLREWLRSDARLGIAHLSIPVPEVEAATATRSRGATRGPSEPPAVGPRPGTARSAAAAPSPRPSFQCSAEVTQETDLPALCDTALRDDAARAALDQLDRDHVRGCTRCSLFQGRQQTVFGVGHVRAELMFVGEGPGADEDRMGQPFVGAAGQLLTRMIAAMSLTREQVYICNVVKCRPPANRTPSEDEMRACAPYLWRQIALVRPHVIVALGRPAAQTLLATTAPISSLRGQFHDFPPLALRGLGLPPAKLMPTFHPAYLLRSPGEKAKSWDDLKQVMQFLGIAIPRSSGGGT